MKVTKIFLVAAIFSMSSYTFAGVKDKKSMVESEATVAAAIGSVKTACGNAKLDSKIDWNNWDKYDYKKMGSEKADVLRYVGGLTQSVLEAMVELCKDADFKAEVAKVISLNISGKDDQADPYVAFSRSGNVLNMALNADGVSSWKNAELLKAVWE